MKVNLTRLPKEQRRPVWEAIQQHDPALAALLTEAPLQKVVEVFSGEIIIDVDENKKKELCEKLKNIRTKYSES